MDFSYLPAWRWTFPAFHTNYGIGDTFTSAIMALAQIFANLADGIWFVLLWVVKLATDTNIISSATKGIDTTASNIFHAIAGIGGSNPGALIGGFLIAIILYAIWRGLKAGPGMAIRTGLRCALPLFILVAMGSAAASDNGTGTVPLSPGWIAKQLDGYVTQIGAFVPTLIPTPAAQAVGSRQPNCANYENGLQQEFANSAQSNTSLVDAKAEEGIPETVNQLWMDSWLKPWEFTQYGDPTIGQRVGCRQLEAINNVPASRAPAFGGSNPVAAGQKQIELAGGNAPPGLNSGIYNIAGDPNNLTREITAFASCAWNGSSWVVTSSMNKVNGGPGGSNCATWWEQGQLQPSGVDYFCTACNGQTAGNIQTATGVDTTANTVFQAWNGHNASLGVMAEFFSLASAVVYAVALGGLSLGTVIAQILLIVLLALLPLLLLLMALPSEQSSRIASKCLKVALGAAVSKIVFLFILGVLVDLISIISSIPGISDGSGIGSVFVTAITPLLAFLALHFALKSAGFSGVMGIKGAIATTAAITSGAARGGAGLTGPEQRLANRMRHPLAGRGASAGGRLGSGGQITKQEALARPGGARSPNAGPRRDPRRTSRRPRYGPDVPKDVRRRDLAHEGLGWLASTGAGGVAAAQLIAGTVHSGRQARQWGRSKVSAIQERVMAAHTRMRAAAVGASDAAQARWNAVREDRLAAGRAHSAGAQAWVASGVQRLRSRTPELGAGGGATGSRLARAAAAATRRSRTRTRSTTGFRARRSRANARMTPRAAAAQLVTQAQERAATIAAPAAGASHPVIQGLQAAGSRRQPRSRADRRSGGRLPAPPPTLRPHRQQHRGERR